MKFILVANVLENDKFINFLEDALVQYPDASFILAGDILNVFPETNEDIEDSMVYELYGRWITDELAKLRAKNFSFFQRSPFTKALEKMFLPMGEYYQKAHAMAERRYEKIFSHIETILGQNKLYFIPGDMDYPILAEYVARRAACFHSLDCRILKLAGSTFAGLGGNPANLHPVRGLIDSTLNPMAPAEFSRKLHMLRNVDVLVTHVAPEESSELKEFLRNAEVKILICRSPFHRQHKTNIRGKLEISQLFNTTILKVCPFAAQEHQAMVVDISNAEFVADKVQIFNWG